MCTNLAFTEDELQDHFGGTHQSFEGALTHQRPTNMSNVSALTVAVCQVDDVM